MAGVRPQVEAGAARLAHRLQAMFGNADHHLELVGAGDPHDALALGHDLADLGLHSRDDAGGVGVQLGVGEVVLGGRELAPGLLDARLAGSGQ